MYTHGKNVLNIGVPGTPLSFTSQAVVGTTTCPVGPSPVHVHEFAVTISTAVTVSAAVAQLIWRPNVASTADQIVVETITLPVGAAIGQVYKKRVSPQKIGPGGFFVVNVTSTATAGAGYGHVEVCETNDNIANSALAVESA